MASTCCRQVITFPPRSDVVSCDRIHKGNFSGISVCGRNSKLQLTASLKISSRKESNLEEHDDEDGKKRHKLSTWKKWVVGISVSVILPSYRHKLGPFGILKNRVNEVIETTETVTEVVENVAEGVKSLAEELEKRLPDKDIDGTIKEALDLVGKLAEETIKTTDLAQELIDKVEEAEEMLEDVLPIAEARKQKQKDESRDKHW